MFEEGGITIMSKSSAKSLVCLCVPITGSMTRYSIRSDIFEGTYNLVDKIRPCQEKEQRNDKTLRAGLLNEAKRCQVKTKKTYD